MAMDHNERGAFIAQRMRVALGCAAVWLALLLYRPFAFTGPVLCPLHGVMGLPCPACGLTRALTALAQGDIVSALWWNALSLPVAALLLLAPLVALWELAAGRRYEFYRRVLFSQRAAMLAGACVIVYHVTRTFVWQAQGVVFEKFLLTSWSYRLFEHFTSGS